MIDVKDVYERYLLRKREESREKADQGRPKDKPYYRISSAGMCARKIYYETIVRIEPTEEINPKTRRVFRLGDLVHQDIQKAIEEDI